MARPKPLRVGCAPLTKTIFAGHVHANGRLWLSDKTDVTNEALCAVIERIGPGNVEVVSLDGTPAFEIEVRAIPPKGLSADLV